MNTRVQFNLTEEEYIALREDAAAHLRGADQQALHVIRKHLKRKGRLPATEAPGDPEPASGPTSGEPQ